jgi:cytochrome c551/c552
VPELPPDDPVIRRSLSVPLLISVFLLVLTVAWSLYLEFYGLRPWRGYQSEFGEVYSKYLVKAVAKQKAAEESVYSSAQFKQLKEQAEQLQKAARPQDDAIEKQIALLDLQRAAMLEAYQDARGRVGALIYDYEIVPEGDKGTKKDRLETVNKGKAKTYEIDWPVSEGKTEARKLNYDQLNALFPEILAKRAALVAKRGEADSPAKETNKKLAEYVSEKLPGLSSASLEGLLHSAESINVTLRQINVNPPGASINYLGGAGLVDRCQSCHIGMDQTLVPLQLTLTKADLGLAKSHDAPFNSHPTPELLTIHPLEKFGCSPCHGGNGRAIDSVTRGHGRYEHWLWPLYYSENYDAGCQQCHAADMVTDHADVLNHGKQLYRLRGCIGCHRFQGFDNQDEQLVGTRQKIAQLSDEKKQDDLEIPRLQKAGDNAPDNQAAQKLYARATNLTVRVSKIDGQTEQLEQLSHSLLEEIKKVGPDLKDARLKLRKEWIPYWLENTHEFRPTTKMPQFRFAPGESQAIAAFIWQNALTGPALEHQQPGNAARGKELFEERGCMACHSMGEAANLVGGDFAANLSRVGEKENYDYVVRWVHNARQRTRPYCPYEKRDLGPEDYAKHGLPFVFDLDHSRCPNDGHELVVQQPTVMPNLRLTWDDARDVASYVIAQKHPDATYPPADFMDDPKLKAKGEDLVKHYGCAGCHEIRGLEDEGRIGTELTNEGSKPIERLDFSLYTEDAKRAVVPQGVVARQGGGPWYDSKGFFENKLSNPGLFDTGKYHTDPMDRLRMPKPNLRSKDEMEALVTMLLGSTDPTLPPDYIYKPADQRRAIQEGWWIVTKYNCIGCHQISVGQKTVMQDLPQYQGDATINLPPVLTSEGARVNPDWLKQFLANPPLSTTDTNRNGVRTYLQVRMPTFYLSDEEIRKLVLFFGALSSQAQPYIPLKLEPLTQAERGMARALFTSPAAPCLKCHATGNPAHDKNATAPNFLLARDRLRSPWVDRWLLDPAKIIPGTAMPSGLFRREGDRWVFAGPLPPALQKYPGDHADLLVRYMFQLTPGEQSMLLGRTPSSGSSGSGGH